MNYNYNINNYKHHYNNYKKLIRIPTNIIN